MHNKINRLIMELPQIVEDDKAMKGQLTDLIQQRYQLSSNESRFNFQNGELALINNMESDDQLIKALHSLLNIFLKNRVQNGYCYFTLKALLENALLNKSEKIARIEQQAVGISNKTSKYNRINHLILMRQILLGKLEDKVGLTKQIEEDIDDIRFITQEVINAIRKWKDQLHEQGLTEQNVIYIYKNYNYITKIIIDNALILANFNKKQDLFMSSPNPFFLMTHTRIKGMSPSTINSLNEILSEEKALELKMMLDSPYLKALKNHELEKQLKILRSKVQEDKTDKIRTVYNAGKSASQDFRYSKVEKILSSTKERAENISIKNHQSIKNLDQLIKQKEIQVLQQMKKRKVAHQSDKKQEKSSIKEGNVLGYKSKLESLREKVQKNVNLNRQKDKRKSPLPKVQAELKATKPKIRVVCEREVPVQNVAKNIFEMMMGESKQHKINRSRSTFYKQMKVEGEKGEEDKKASQSKNNIMINSAYSFKSLPSSRKQRSTSVNFKLRKTSAKKVKQNDSNNHSREEQIKEVKQSIAILNSRIREQSIKNIYSNNQDHSKAIKAQPSQNIEKNPVENKKQNLEEKIQYGQSTNDFEDRLKQKERNIQELKERLRYLRANNSQQSEIHEPIPLHNSAVSEAGNLRQQREKLELQNMRIKQQMKLEEMRYLTLKEQQYKLKEEEMQKIYKHKLDRIKEELTEKEKQFEGKIVNEKKRNQQMELKYKEVTKKTEQIKLQLEEKQIKEQLFSQIFKEETARRDKQKQWQQEEERSFMMMEEFRRQQERYKQELQRKAMEVFEQQKLKLRALQLQIQKKNKELEDKNRQQQEQIDRLELQKKLQQEQFSILQSEVEERSKDIRLDKHLQNHNHMEIQQVQPEKDNLYQLDDLRERVKMELLEQIKKKRQLEQEEEKAYQQQRKQHLLQLEEQMRKALRLEDDQLQRIEEQYRQKNQSMVRQYEQQMLRKQKHQQQMELNSKKKMEDAQYRQPFQLERLVTIQTGLEGGVTKAIQQKKGEEQQSMIDKKQKEDNKKQLINVQAPQQKNNAQDKPILVKEEQMQEHPKREQNASSPVKGEQVEVQSPTKLPQQKDRPTQTVKHNIQEVHSKYQQLLSLISKPIKQLYFVQSEVEPYLNKFYTLLQPQVKQMLPYSRNQIEAIFKSKRVDVFDNYSFGWYKPKEKKFMLLGSFQAIPIIAAKYGQIQIEQVFIFSRGNAYQKQFLSKLIKIYQKIGYIYQKKTHQEGKYSIKFIVKSPKQSGQQPLTDNLQIKTKVIFQQHQEDDQETTRSNCIYYILSQGLSELLSEEQKIQIAGKESHEHKYLNKKINQEPLNNTVVKTEKHTDQITQVNISIPINYIQTAEQAFYSLSSIQYEISASHQKVYVSFYKQQKIGLAVHKMKSDDVPRQFHLDSFIQTRFKNMKQDKQVKLFLPIWQNNINFKSKGSVPQSFIYKQSSKPDLAYGSIINSRVHKGEFVYLEPPFVFVVFQLNSANIMRRILFGHLVKDSQVLTAKKVLSTF